MGIISFIEKINKSKALDNKFSGFRKEGIKIKSTENETMNIVVFDTETTGLNVDPVNFPIGNSDRDEVIEFAARLIKVDASNFDILEVMDSIDVFQEPVKELTQEITDITGITKEMLSGKSIDWDVVNSFMDQGEIVIAHNVNFDKNALHGKITGIFKWMDSCWDVPWKDYDCYDAKQDTIALAYGFTYDAHRADIDVDALVQILILSKKLPELIENGSRVILKILGWGGYKFKDYLKLDLGFKYNKTPSYWFGKFKEKDVKLKLKEIEDKFEQVKEKNCKFGYEIE